MAISELSPPRLAVRERAQLRADLEVRRRGLLTALDVYSDAGIETVPRRALIRRTRVSLGEVSEALRLVDCSDYGLCRVCRRPLPIATLAVRPLAARCAGCVDLGPVA